MLSKGKLKVHDTLVSPVVANGLVFVIKGLQFKVFESNVIRRIYDATKVNDEWKIKNNSAVETMLENNTISCIKASKLRESRKVFRMENENTGEE